MRPVTALEQLCCKVFARISRRCALSVGALASQVMLEQPGRLLFTGRAA